MQTLDDMEPAWLSPPDTRSSSASRGSSPPPLDDVDADPPSFEDSASDPLVASSHRFDMPNPRPSPSLPSPSLIELDATDDSDEETSKLSERRKRPTRRLAAHHSEEDDDEMV